MDSQFRNLDPIEAMEKFRELLSGGTGATLELKDPKSLQLIRTVANVSDAEIAIWLNRVVPKRDPERYIDFDTKMKKIRTDCRKVLGMEPLKTKEN